MLLEKCKILGKIRLSKALQKVLQVCKEIVMQPISHQTIDGSK